MEVYEPTRHYSMMSSWYVERNMQPIPNSFFPQTGFIVPDVAACFLFRTDSRLGIIDGLVSNPRAERKQVVKAFQAIIQKLIEKAHEFGIHFLMAFTEKPEVTKRASRFGFRQVLGRQTVFTRNLIWV